MEKRGCIEVESPPNHISHNGTLKKVKIATISNENNGNAINLNFPIENSDLDPGFDVNELCFDDDDDFDMDIFAVSEINFLIIFIKLRINFRKNLIRTRWIFLNLSAVK